MEIINRGVEFLLASLVVFIFGMAMLLLGSLSGKKRRDILRNGVEVTGTVASIDKCFDDNRYQYRITYQTKKGETITGRWDEFHSIPYCRKHPVGSTYQIVYLPQRPTRFVVKESSGLNAGFVFMSFVGVSLIVFSLFILFSAFKEGAFK